LNKPRSDKAPCLKGLTSMIGSSSLTGLLADSGVSLACNKLSGTELACTELACTELACSFLLFNLAPTDSARIAVSRCSIQTTQTLSPSCIRPGTTTPPSSHNLDSQLQHSSPAQATHQTQLLHHPGPTPWLCQISSCMGQCPHQYKLIFY
jgi:hypothetical protein